jgi:NADH:ubiquinone oxidoreductase subunit 3 (subunit A)
VLTILLTPPVAFLLYIPLVMLIVWAGRQLAGPSPAGGPARSSAYGSGEKAPNMAAAPGYKPFFLVALFFAILHLGMLVLGTGNLSGQHALYLVGLALALVALILG